MRWDMIKAHCILAGNVPQRNKIYSKVSKCQG